MSWECVSQDPREKPHLCVLHVLVYAPGRYVLLLHSLLGPTGQLGPFIHSAGTYYTKRLWALGPVGHWGLSNDSDSHSPAPVVLAGCVVTVPPEP